MMSLGAGRRRGQTFQIYVGITSRFINNIICRRRVPKLIGSVGKLVKGVDGYGKMSLDEGNSR